MNRASVAVVLTVATMMAGAGASFAMSEKVLVDTSPYHNRHWTTVYTNEVPLSWDWVAAATHAELEIVGMKGTFTTNFTEVASNYLWRVFTSSVPSAEDVYDLKLTFYDSGTQAVGSLTSRLAVVTGAFGKAVVDPGPSDKKWTTVSENVVIPYDASWAASTAYATASQLVITKSGGSTQTNMLADADGYFGWKLKDSGWGYGTFDLALTFPDAEGEWVATLAYVPVGILILIR